jgi:uncharacterized protein YyaL (SSP411 family)
VSNRLAQATSPYLLQHADNPVDWWEWSEEAFAEARRRDVPVLLSVGYAACHWCHVMAHESFEDEATAAYMNEHFVNIKVDREERPDVDSVYMEATQAMTGHGGWPMTCLLTGDGAPFFCGTYFPNRPRHGMPSFDQVLQALADAWNDRRDEVSRVGAQVVDHLRADRSLSDGAAPSENDLSDAVAALGRDFDRTDAGFGGAPKFPPSMVLEALLRHAARTGSQESLGMVDATASAMARGGMYDQLGGGFARYSVDKGWVVPHFEKMLYDNALLLRFYLHWWRQTGDPLGRRVAEETADFLLRELRTPEGGFASALDADSEVDGHSVEGAFYAWTPRQLTDVLGADDGAWAAKVFTVTAEGTFEHGSSTLQLRADPDPDEMARLADVRRRLSEARDKRARPARDDKAVAAWNGLAIAALAEAGMLLERADLVDAARTAGELLWRVHADGDGRIARVSRAGEVGVHAGVLDDYSCVADGYLVLLGVTGDPVWLRRAGTLLDHVLQRFSDGRGGFYDTADDAEQLVRRPQDPTDNATPSGQSAAAGALLTYAAVTGSSTHREAAEAALGTTRALSAKAPRFAGWGLAVAEALLAGPAEVAVVGAAEGPDRAALHRAAWESPAPGAAIVVGESGGASGEGASGDGVPLLRDRPLVDGAAAAYVCRGFVCERPVTDPAALREALGASREKM